MINRYSNIGILKSSTGNRYYKTNYYPDIPLASNDIYVITTEGDRYEILAQQYYSDSSLWWVIITANPQLPQNSLTPPYGVQLRIPGNIAEVLAQYNLINQQ